MLGQFNQALSGTIGPCLLVMSLSVLLTVGEGRNRPASRRWRAIGVAIGLAAAVVFAILRGTAILNRRSTVNLPTLILGVILDIALIAVIVRSQGIVERWRRTSASRVSADEKDDASVRRARLRMTVANGIAAADIAVTIFFAMPDVILQLTNFVDTGDSPFTSDMLLRALGFLLGIGMTLIVAAVFHTLRTPDIRRAFTAAALIVAILQLVMHATELFSLLMNMMILVLHGPAFRVLILLHNHELWMTYAQALAFLIPAVASIIIGLRTTPNGGGLPGDAAIPPLNEAGVRARIAFRRRAVAAGAWSMAAAIALTALLAWGTYELNKQPVISEPEEYSLVDGVATIPFSQVEDGHLHRFAYTAADGTEMRFIIILKNGGAYGVGLDACETCGDAGYYEQDGKIICKRCDVAINLATIGFKGGCNPIPFPYQVDDGAIIIHAADLDALSAHFQ